ncbi:CDP-glycerol:glycerophosphate glycerophosphotransferase, partial [Staphylococcus shinii]
MIQKLHQDFMPNLDETPRRTQLHTDALVKVARHLNVAILSEKKLLFSLEMLAFAMNKPALALRINKFRFITRHA